MTFDNDAYFDWLYHEAFDSSRYYDMMRDLHEIPFTWTVESDKNRAADGISMRRSYLFEEGRSRENYYWPDEDCTFFEMLVGLANKFGMLLDKTLSSAVSHLIRNTDLEALNENGYTPRELRAVVNFIMDREYDDDGHGGFFPLDDAPNDQRRVELLYQMNYYILEYGY